MTINNRIRTTVLLLAGAVSFIGSTTQAQIASYVDERGKLIYTNENYPQPRHGSNIGRSLTVPRERLTSGLRAAPSNDAKAPIWDGDFAVNSHQEAGSRLDRIVLDAAQRHRLDPALVKAVISTESGWNTRAISQKGAIGLMQLIPSTAQRFGVGNPFDPAQNVEGGTLYLKSLLDRYNGDLTKSLAAYNAGEGAVDASHGVPAYPETQKYVQKVTRAYFRPDSGRSPTLWSRPRSVVRQEIGTDGRLVFTNE